MASLDAAYRTTLIAEVGDPNGTIAQLAHVMWDTFASRGVVNPRLQYLYAKRALIDVRMAEEQAAVDINATGDVQITQSQRFDHLQEMRAHVSHELERIENRARSARPPRSGALTTTAPTSPPYVDSADRNDPRYTGNPYISNRRPY